MLSTLCLWYFHWHFHSRGPLSPENYATTAQPHRGQSLLNSLVLNSLEPGEQKPVCSTLSDGSVEKTTWNQH